MSDATERHQKEEQHVGMTSDMKTEIAGAITAAMADAMREVTTVNTKSLDFNIGSLVSTLESLGKQVNEQNSKLDGISSNVNGLERCFNKQISELPCASHGADIKKVVEYVDEQKGTSSKMKLAVFSAGMGSLITLLTQFVFPKLTG